MRRLTFILTVIATLLMLASPGGSAQADEGWTIDSYDVTYDIHQSGLVRVTEDIQVDFGFLQKHGIFRDIPVRYDYDEDHDRLISPGNISVDDGKNGEIPFDLINSSANLRIKIGDPDKLITGKQRYRISYPLTGAMNRFPDHDEFYWNVMGNEWPVRIIDATATVMLPGGKVTQSACFQGPADSTEQCSAEVQDNIATFSTTRELSENEGMTLVAGLPLGIVEVGPPVLVAKAKSDTGQFLDLFKINPYTVAASLVLGVMMLTAVARLWWVEGRDRWLGDMFYLNDGGGTGVEATKPILAHESVVVEFAPPELGRKQRRLRPAEIGVLLDERADTLDVSATIVDLAVRKHLKITEEKSGGIFGLFKKKDYQLDRLGNTEDELLSYESQLKDAFFDDGDSVKLSDLKNKFHKDLAKVKKALYSQSMKNGFFARNPETTTTVSRVAGIVIALVGGGLVFGLGKAFGGGLIGVPIICAGLLIFLLAPAMPRRTGKGRMMYRRSLGFRKFMVTAETDRQKFAENANIFHEYLPYAIVYGCVDRWASVLKDLGIDPGEPYYYAGRGPFVAAAFANSVSSFSSSISSTMASTPGGSGSSGFGGGGSSGGGGGGGGGGSW
jgi:uncharacterized membrane protein YgcG